MSTLQQRADLPGPKALSLSSPMPGPRSIQQTKTRTLSSGAFSSGASSDASRSHYNPNGGLPVGSSQPGSMSLAMPTSGSFGSATGSTHGSYTMQGALRNGQPTTPLQTPRRLISSPILSPRSVGSTISHSSAYRPQNSGVVQSGSSSVTSSVASGAGPVSSCFSSRSSSATMPPRSSANTASYKVGDRIDIWSTSQNAWRPGSITKVDGEWVHVSYADATGMPMNKIMPNGHAQLRLQTGLGTTTSASTPSPVSLTGMASLGGSSTLSSSSRPISRMSSTPHSHIQPSPLKVRDSAVMNNSRPTDHLGSQLSALRTATRSFSNNIDGMLNNTRSFSKEGTAGPAIAKSPEYGYSNDRTMRPTADLIAAKKEAVVQSPLRTDDLERQVGSAFGAWTLDVSAKTRAETAAARVAVDKAAERAKAAHDIAAARAEKAEVARENLQAAADRMAAGRQRVERAAVVQAAAQKLAAIRAEAEEDWDRAVQTTPRSPEQAAALPVPPGPMLKRTTAEKSIESGFVTDTSTEANANGLVTTASHSEDQQLVEQEYRAKLLEQAGANAAQANAQARQAAEAILPVARDLAEKARSTLSLAGHQLDSAKKAATEATLRASTEREAGPSRWEMAANVALDQVAMLQGLALADLQLAEDSVTRAEQSPR